MKRFTSFILMMAMLVGLLPAHADEVEVVNYLGEGLTSYWYSQGGKLGLMAEDGTIVTEPLYDQIKGYSDGYAQVRQGESWGLLDASGKLAVPLVYEYIGEVSQGISCAVKNGKFGYLRASDGSPITEFVYDRALDFWNVGKVERNVDDRCYFGAIDRTGKLVVPMEYSHIYLSPKGDAYITQNTDWAAGMREYYGAYDLDGNLLYPCEFTSEERLLAAIANGRDDPSLVEESSQTAGLSVTWYPECEAVTRCYGTDRMVLSKQGRAGIFGLDGTAYTDYVYDVLEYSGEENVFLAVRNGKWGRLSRNGEVVTEFLYGTKEEAAQEAKAQMVQEPGGWKYAVADMEGNLLTEYIYEAKRNFSHGYAAVFRGSSGEGWGYVNEKGEEVIPCQYYSGGVQDFAPDGYAIVYSNDHGYNVVDTTGREVFPQDGYISEAWRAGQGLWGRRGENGVEFWSSAGELIHSGSFGTYTNPKGFTFGNIFDEEGRMAVYSGSSKPVYYVNIDGERVEPPAEEEYIDEDLIFHEGLRWVNREGKHDAFWPMEKGWGFENEAGELTVPYLYDAVGYFDHGYASVRLDGVYGLLKNPLRKDKVDHWAVAEVDAATEAGYVTESCKAYQTYTITREQFASLAVNYLEKKTGQAIPPAPADTFTDTVDEDVLKAYAAGIVQGMGGGLFGPGRPLSREQLATMLWRAMTQAGVTAVKLGAYMSPDALSDYTDASQVSDWARDSVAALAGLKVMEGTGGGMLSPKASCTVEQAILLVYRAAEGEQMEQAAQRQAAIGRVTIEGIKIGTPFDELPSELRGLLKQEGESYDSGVFNPGEEIGRRYKAPGIVIITSEATEKVLKRALEGQSREYLLKYYGSEDWKTVYAQMSGREYVDTVILTDDTFHMVSGLKVGDSEERVKELGYALAGETYSGTAGFDGSADIFMGGNKVVRIEAYDCIGRRIGAFFDP